MQEVLVALAALAAFGVCGMLTTIGIVRWRLGRRNRIDPAQPSPAPLRWLASPSEPARLHRRLRTVARIAIVDTEIDESATGEVLRVTTRIDQRLVLAATSPTVERRRRLQALRHEVADLETLTTRLARPLTGPRGAEPIDTLRLLADARDEIEAVDQVGHPQLTEPVRVETLTDSPTTRSGARSP